MKAAPLPLRVALSGKDHEALRKHLFPGDGKEAVAFALCRRSPRASFELLTVVEIVPIDHQLCRVRTPTQVTWPGEILDAILTKATAGGLTLIKIHSHPTGFPWFSTVDDASDSELFPSIFSWLDTSVSQASMIMLPDGKLVGRQLNPTGIGSPIECVRVAGDDFQYWFHDDQSADIAEGTIRVAQAFGEQTYRKLNKLRIGVAGNSGTGSIVIEQLARNGVGELLLIDPEGTDRRNLNRILNSTADDARRQIHKPLVQKRAIARMGLGTKVQVLQGDLMSVEALKALSTCDVLFGCMDSVDGRHILNKLASSYLIPLIDVGVRLEADGQGGIESIWAVVHTILPGRSSLLSRRVYNPVDLSAAFLKRTNPKEYDEQLKVGYIKGEQVDRPAVISVNMVASAAAVNELLARVHPYRVKPNREFAINRISLSDPEAGGGEREGVDCPVMKKVCGLGDQKPFLGMIGLQGE